ncbi:MAG: hypothetical protein IJD92_04515 [Bacilli bacterium]|nr:hypothetical protein [Bacilli bacterium]
MVKNRIKQNKIVSGDELKIRNLIILLVSVIVICVGVYFLTEHVLNKETESNQTDKKVEINYDIASIGTMFNRIEDEYYVILYSSKDSGSELDSVLDSYRSSDNYIKTYYVDLNLKINKSALKGKLVEKPNNSNEISVKEATLFKIESGKVTKCYSGVDNIIDVLK